jgi:hypothetical protein
MTASRLLSLLALSIAAALVSPLDISGAQAATFSAHADDSDLTGPVSRRRPEAPPLELKADQVQSTASATGDLAVKILREDHGALTPVSALTLAARSVSALTGLDGSARLQSACSGSDQRVVLTATLANKFFSVRNDDGPYSISFEAPCRGEVTATFKSDSNGGQALGIWQIAEKARAKLEASIGLDFWKSSLDFNWPADADYYNWGQVHITRGDHWDVVGHEMGHGIYDLGELGQFGGGPHKIDECYSPEMALSEGWASYFSGWVSVDLNDADAKFEYMVPRRAPIRFETIPADVCAGERNEWRVTGFFWDLIDLHDDGESMSSAFSQVWDALKGSRVRTTSEAKERLEKAGMDPTLVETIWKLNFRT